jgi:Flp pilus assembly pilin Flp
MWVRIGSFIARLRRDSRGVATTEYTILLGTVALGSAVSFIAVGIAIVHSFAEVRELVLVPFP